MSGFIFRDRRRLPPSLCIFYSIAGLVREFGCERCSSIIPAGADSRLLFWLENETQEMIESRQLSIFALEVTSKSRPAVVIVYRSDRWATKPTFTCDYNDLEPFFSSDAVRPYPGRQTFSDDLSIEAISLVLNGRSREKNRTCRHARRVKALERANCVAATKWFRARKDINLLLGVREAQAWGRNREL